MRSKNKTVLIVFLVFAITGATTFAAFQSQKANVSTGQDQTPEVVLPIVNYESVEPLDSEKDKRLARGKHYDQPSSKPITEAPYSFERIRSSYWWKDLPPLPVLQSDAIIIGEVIDAQAHLSNDKTGVYSEFAVRVDQVLKDSSFSMNKNPMISVERFGGAVLFPSGSVQKYRIQGQGMPISGRHYVLFLNKLDQGEASSILTGYELRGRRVVPLDGGNEQGNERLPFDSHRGAEVSSFLKLVQGAITQTTPNSAQ